MSPQTSPADSPASPAAAPVTSTASAIPVHELISPAGTSTSSVAPPASRLERLLGFISALPVALIVTITFVDVFARYLFAAPVRGSVEIIEQAMALTIFTALPLVTHQRQHVSVGLFDDMVKGRARRFKVAVCDAISCIALALLTWRLWLQAVEELESRNVTLVLGLPQAPLVFAMALLAAITTAVMLTLTWNSVRSKGGFE